MNNNYKIPEHDLREQAMKEGITRFTLAAAIVMANGLLLVRRVPEDFMGGLYELPGGHIDEDETFQTALEREILEETGLKIKNIIGMIDGFDYIEEDNTCVRQFNFVVTINEGEIKLATEEHDHYVWITKETSNKVELSPEMKAVVTSYFVKHEKN